MRFHAIIFDLDGTLVDSYPGILHSLNFVLHRFGRAPVDLATVKKMVGRGVENLMKQAVGDENVEQAIALFREDYDRSHLEGSFLMPHVMDTLAQLDGSYAMAVASNKPPDYTRSILKHLQIDRFFLKCAGPGGEILPKPDPTMLSYIMSSLRVEADKALYVGDMPLDAQTARNAGVSVALIPGGGGTMEELLNAAPDFLLERFSDLLAVLESAEAQ